VIITSDLSAPPASTTPLAPNTGPFPQRDFLSAWHEELGHGTEVSVADWGTGELTLMKHPDGLIELLGEEDLCDYHSPLGIVGSADVASLVSALGDGDRLSFDSLPVEAAAPIFAGLTFAGLQPSCQQHQSALVLKLPSAVDDFYLGLSKKDRHELRRKRRRYEELIGKVVLRTDDQAGTGFEEFIRLHRMAAGPKGQFMNGARERFFRRLAGQPGWRTDYLATPNGATACLFGFAENGDYYLYNSSFDPALSAGSPGLVVLTSMIEHAIGEAFSLFDFLKGDEDYKRRLGATRRPLYRIEAKLEAR
jgi:CelD/BcsL family acetyltransferase involved in cellulose biosynthesis